MKTKHIFLLFILTLYFALILADETDPYVVRIKSGLIKGFDQEGSMAFLGIPYAKVERFMPPLPVDSWDDVRVCDHWGPQVMQNTNQPLSENEMSEKNSCVLNVWTTDKKAKKPYNHIRCRAPGGSAPCGKRSRPSLRFGSCGYRSERYKK